MLEFFADGLRLLLSVVLGLLGLVFQVEEWKLPQLFPTSPSYSQSLTLEDIPPYADSPYVVIRENKPGFTPEELERLGEEAYSPLDGLGRCGPAFGVIGPETMPTEERGSIGQIKPSGWHLVKYDCVDGKYLYNRCHLIAYQLSGENANRENLITGTRYLNVEGMLPLEREVADYVEKTGNHVAYRVSPFFVGEELLARGVHMEAWSVEDRGTGVCFNLYLYNVQPGVEIDYATGESWLEGEKEGDEKELVYILNVKTGRFHDPGCSGVANMDPDNKKEMKDDRYGLIARGYTPCGICCP